MRHGGRTIIAGGEAARAKPSTAEGADNSLAHGYGKALKSHLDKVSQAVAGAAPGEAAPAKADGGKTNGKDKS